MTTDYIATQQEEDALAQIMLMDQNNMKEQLVEDIIELIEQWKDLYPSERVSFTITYNDKVVTRVIE